MCIRDSTFSSYNNGITISVNQTNEVLTPLNNSKDTVSSGNVSLATTTTFFSSASSVGLPDGVEGQIKVFTSTSTTGSTTSIAVATAGWKGGSSGTIVIGTLQGDSCTLQYTNSAWYCIGNNGAIFS